jgi:hypothetical protein
MVIELNSQNCHHSALRDADAPLAAEFINVGFPHGRGKNVEIPNIEVALRTIFMVAVVTEGDRGRNDMFLCRRDINLNPA